MLISKKWSFFIVALLATWLVATIARAQAPWHMPGASARFGVEITTRPTVPAAGIVGIVPDAGILPRGKLNAGVVDHDGKPLRSNLLWHNPDEGLALVFEDTAATNAWIYVSAAADYPKATAPLRPSLLLYVRNSAKPGLDEAHALEKKMPAGPDTYFALSDRIFHSYLPIGRDDQTSALYSGWIIVKKAGKTYFYTVSKDGSEFAIDGKQVFSWPGLHDREAGRHAEQGAWINLSAGEHRIDYYHFAQSLVRRESQLGWQPAGEREPDDPKNPKLPNLAVTGPMETSDFVHSGVARLEEASSRQGPLASFSYKWDAIIQPGQSPTCLFNFEALGRDRLPTNTVFEWDFGAGRKVLGSRASWLFGGTGDQRVGLTVSSPASKSTCSRLFFPKSLDPARSPPRLSINRPDDRRKVRDLFLAMCRATPAGQRPAEHWNATLWECLAAVMDEQSEYALLHELFERSRPDILKLPDDQRWRLEDVFYDALRQKDRKQAINWRGRLEKEEKTAMRRGQWKARLVEFYIFEGDNLNQARSAANEFAGAAAGVQQAELALIRLGDVELFNGQQDAARRYYAQAQELHRTRANTAPGGSDKTALNLKSGTQPKPGGKPAGQTALTAPLQGAGATRAIETWKVSAVQASAYYATLRSLIAQKLFFEARVTLDRWELEIPLDKLAGDFPLAAAEYYLALGQCERSRKILATYRQAVDLSNALPQAMKMELHCLTRLGRGKEAHDLGLMIIKRLPNHPMSREVKEILARAADDGQLTALLEAWSRDWAKTEKADAAGLASLFGGKEIRNEMVNKAPQK